MTFSSLLHSNIPIKIILSMLAILTALGIGRAVATDYAMASLGVISAIALSILLFRFPSLPIVVLYPMTWILWAYTIPGIGNLERIIGTLGIGGMALLALKRERIRIAPMPPLVIVGLFILLTTYWISWTLHTDIPRAQEYMISLTARVAFFWVIYNLVRTAEHLQWAITLLIGATLVAAIMTLGVSLTFGFGYSREFEASLAASQALGSLGQAIVTAANFGTASAVLLLGLLPLIKNRTLQIAVLILVLFLFSMAFASQYRREILIAVPTLLIFLSLDQPAGLRRPALGLLFVSLLIFFFVILPFSSVLQNRLDNETQFVVEGTEPRIASFRAGVEAFLQSPIVGHGPSTYRSAIAPILGVGRRSWEYSPYNVFIWIAVEAGVFGLLGVGLILWGVFREAIKFRSQVTGIEGWILRCAPTLLLLILIWYTFGNWWDLSLTWFLMGLILVAARLAKESAGSAATV